MEIDQFRGTLRTMPFKPFVIHTSSGEKYGVSHPEAVWQSPGGKTVIVSVKGEEVALIDIGLISEVVFTKENPVRASE